MKKTLYPVISVMITSLLLMWYAFYNGYPMATSDTGAYINFAYDFAVLKDRSSFYSIWLAVTGLRTLQFAGIGGSLWLPVFFQCVLLSTLLFRYYCLLAQPAVTKYINYILAIAVVAFSTGLSFVAVYIMPDIFTGILLLAIILYIYDDNATVRIRLMYSGIIGFSILVHNSHFLIVPVFCIGMLVFALLTKKYLLRTRLLSIFGIAATCWLLVCTINFVYGFGFTLSAGSHVFMAGKLVETGTMKKYLDEQCIEHEYKLCAYKDQLPQKAYQYIWDGQGPFQKIGGWDSSGTEHKAIIRDVFTSPKYITHFAGTALLHTWQQLQYIHIVQDDQAFGEWSSPHMNIERHIKAELGQFMDSRQQQHLVDNSYWINIQSIVLILSLAWVGLLIAGRRLGKKITGVYIILMAFIVCNAFVTASFANVLERLQNRVFWVLPTTNILVLWSYYSGAGIKIRIFIDRLFSQSSRSGAA